MKRPIAIFLPVSLMSVMLFVLGMYFFTPLFMFFEPRVEGISLQVTDLGAGMFKTSVLFSFILALTPVLIWLTWKLGQIVSPWKRSVSGLIILAFILVAIWIRHTAVKSFFTHIAKTMVPKDGSAQVSYPLDPVNFVYYIFAGLCIGCIVAFFLFRRPKI